MKDFLIITLTGITIFSMQHYLEPKKICDFSEYKCIKELPKVCGDLEYIIIENMPYEGAYTKTPGSYEIKCLLPKN